MPPCCHPIEVRRACVASSSLRTAFGSGSTLDPAYHLLDRLGKRGAGADSSPADHPPDATGKEGSKRREPAGREGRLEVAQRHESSESALKPWTTNCSRPRKPPSAFGRFSSNRSTMDAAVNPLASQNARSRAYVAPEILNVLLLRWLLTSNHRDRSSRSPCACPCDSTSRTNARRDPRPRRT